MKSGFSIYRWHKSGVVFLSKKDTPEKGNTIKLGKNEKAPPSGELAPKGD